MPTPNCGPFARKRTNAQKNCHALPCKTFVQFGLRLSTIGVVAYQRQSEMGWPGLEREVSVLKGRCSTRWFASNCYSIAISGPELCSSPPPAWGWSDPRNSLKRWANVLPHPRGDGPQNDIRKMKMTMFSPPAWGWSIMLEAQHDHAGTLSFCPTTDRSHRPSGRLVSQFASEPGDSPSTVTEPDFFSLFNDSPTVWSK